MREAIHVLPGVDFNISPHLLAELNRFQDFIEAQIVVTSAFRKGDTAEHGRGNAVDIIVPDFEGRLLDLYLSAERFGFIGIGLYPEWKFNGKKVGGLHLDHRVSTSGARWMGLGSGKGQQYLAINQKNLRANGVI